MWITFLYIWRLKFERNIKRKNPYLQPRFQFTVLLNNITYSFSMVRKKIRNLKSGSATQVSIYPGAKVVLTVNSNPWENRSTPQNKLQIISYFYLRDTVYQIQLKLTLRSWSGLREKSDRAPTANKNRVRIHRSKTK